MTETGFYILLFLLQFISEEDKRKIYQITDLGYEVLHLELKRIERLYLNAKEVTTCLNTKQN